MTESLVTFFLLCNIHDYNVITRIKGNRKKLKLPVLYSVSCKLATSAPMLGWDVIPDIESVAQSTISAPASAHASIEATPAPAVSCVCTCIGSLGYWARNDPIKICAACGFSKPAISLKKQKIQ